MYEISNLNKVYITGEVENQVLHHINLSIEEGSFVTILGPSGSGKTTLLNILSGLDRDYTGTIKFEEHVISSFTEKQFIDYRKDYISLVFQHYHLLPTLNVRENVEVASQLVKKPFPIDEILQKVGMLEHQEKYPNQLSGGQKQRTAIARAIIKSPKVIFCDEPTGALDSNNAKSVMELLVDLNKKHGVTIVMVTHHEAYVQLATHIIRMSDGSIIEEQKVKAARSIELIEW